MASAAPARVGWGFEGTTQVMQFVPGQATNEPCIPGDFFLLDNADEGQMKRAGTDPAAIAGIAEVDTEAARVLTADGLVPGRLITEATKIILYSATLPVQATHVSNSYGITRNAAGQWLLDTAKTTTASRVIVIGINVDEADFEYFICQFHANALQYDSLSVAQS